MTRNMYGPRNLIRMLGVGLGVAFILGVLVVPGGADDAHKFDSFAKCLGECARKLECGRALSPE